MPICKTCKGKDNLIFHYDSTTFNKIYYEECRTCFQERKQAERDIYMDKIERRELVA